MSSFLRSPCLSRACLCVKVGQLKPGVLCGISRASSAGAGRCCEVSGDPSRCCCSPKNILRVPVWIRGWGQQEEGEDRPPKPGLIPWAACSYLHGQTGICICKYPAVHSITCYAEATQACACFNGSCSVPARWNHGCCIRRPLSPNLMESI